MSVVALTSGAPYAYLPLSLQQPAVMSMVVEKQRSNESCSWRWLLNVSDSDASGGAPLTQVASGLGCEIEGCHELKMALHDAMRSCVNESPLKPCVQVREEMTIKTSNSHPIKCVPFDARS